MSGTTSYVQRKLDFSFTLTGTSAGSQPTFAGTGSDTMAVSGLRARVDLTYQAPPAGFHLQASIYGLPQSVMNDLSTMGKIIGNNKWNKLAVYAGDATNGMALVFTGDIYDAWGNYHDAPNVSFDITARPGGIDSISAVSPISYSGSVDVATILSAIANQMNPPRIFENNGVSVIVHNAYHAGTLTQQVQEVCAMANINYSDDGKTLAIWPQGGSRGGAVPLISPETGMVGYPTYTAQGIDIVTVFNPSIHFGGTIQVKSSVKGAVGNWAVGAMVHNLESQNPGGPWFTAINLIDPVVWKRNYTGSSSS